MYCEYVRAFVSLSVYLCLSVSCVCFECVCACCGCVCMYGRKILEESPVRWPGPHAPITTHKESHGGGFNRVSYTYICVFIMPLTAGSLQDLGVNANNREMDGIPVGIV